MYFSTYVLELSLLPLRLLVAAWETGGLVNADDSCCELIVLAVQVSIFVDLKRALE